MTINRDVCSQSWLNENEICYMTNKFRSFHGRWWRTEDLHELFLRKVAIIWNYLWKNRYKTCFPSAVSWRRWMILSSHSSMSCSHRQSSVLKSSSHRYEEIDKNSLIFQISNFYLFKFKSLFHCSYHNVPWNKTFKHRGYTCTCHIPSSSWSLVLSYLI